MYLISVEQNLECPKKQLIKDYEKLTMSFCVQSHSFGCHIKEILSCVVFLEK